jgi:hypothetical protein
MMLIFFKLSRRFGVARSPLINLLLLPVVNWFSFTEK